MPPRKPQLPAKDPSDSRWTVFSCANYAELVEGLLASLAARSGKPPSIRDLASQLEHAAPAAVHAMVQGRRLLSGPVQRRLAELLGLSAQEARYVQEWVAYERKRRAGRATPEDASRLERANLRRHPQEVLAAERFAYIADWFHLPLLGLIAMPGFRFDLDWIEARLKHKPTTQQIIYSLRVLEQLRLIKRTGRKWTAEKEIATPLDVPSEAVRRHHLQMMERAGEALQEEDVGQRDLSSATFNFDRRRMAEAKAAIEEFRQEFLHRFEGAAASEVFQMNMQLFAHTRPVAPKKR
jgi:uncharacterized protein (TIGR02147 family)